MSAVSLSSPLVSARRQGTRVVFSSKNATPELPVLEGAADQLAGFDEALLLPAAALDIDCPGSYEFTPCTTLPASTDNSEDEMSVGDDGQSSEDQRHMQALSSTSWSCAAHEESVSKIDGYVPMWCLVNPAETCSEVVPLAYADPTELPNSAACIDIWSFYQWQAAAYFDPQAAPTTLVISNLPATLTQEDLLEHLDREEFSGFYDFVYLPLEENATSNRHAIVNFTVHEKSVSLAVKLTGRTRWGSRDSANPCVVSWSMELQGLDDLVRAFQNTPEDGRPEVFKDGWPVAFPERN